MRKLLVEQNGIKYEAKVIKYIQLDNNKKYLIYNVYDNKKNRYIIQAGKVVLKNDYIELVDVEDKEDLKILKEIVEEYYEKN